MKLTVIQRITGGFTILTLLLVLQSVISFQAINTINHDMEIVTEEVTPLVITTGDIIAKILAAGNTMVSIQNSHNLIKLKALINDYFNFLNQYSKNISKLKQLSSAVEDVSLAVKSAEENHQIYLDAAQEMIKIHLTRVDVDNRSSNGTNGHENNAEMLNDENGKTAALSKQLEEILAQTVSMLRKVSKLSNQLAVDAKQQANNSVEFKKTLIVVVTMAAIVIAALVGFWVSLSIRKPLSQIADIFAKVSGGDMTQTIDLKSADEFGQLGNWINNLVSNLRSMMAEITTNSEQLSAAAEETSAITLQTHEGVDQQRDQINQIATAMAEMAATVEDVAASANKTMEEVQKASQQASHGSMVVQQTRVTISNLSNEIDKAGTVIHQLDDHSSSIGAILDVIRGIADQTNLLALNAAIEAARAGEHGRGFSVVADEVRTLASKTQESTADIQHMIEELQQGTHQAVTVMAQSRKDANECIEKSDAASTALETITTAVEAINDMSIHIAQAAKEQNSVTQEMHRNIESISQISEQTALGAGQTAVASQQQSSLANQLQHLVSRFKT